MGTDDQDSVLRALNNAPEDDEPETDPERESAARARQELLEGKTLSHDEVRRRIGERHRTH